MPPSSVVRFEPRKGSLREAFTVVPGIVGPPLSLMKATSVFRSRPASATFWRTRPTASSMANIIAL